MQKYEILLNPSNKTPHFSIAPAALSPASPHAQQASHRASSVSCWSHSQSHSQSRCWSRCWSRSRGFSREPRQAASARQSSRSASKPPCQQRQLLVPLLVPLSVPFSRFFPRASYYIKNAIHDSRRGSTLI